MGRRVKYVAYHTRHIHVVTPDYATLTLHVSTSKTPPSPRQEQQTIKQANKQNIQNAMLLTVLPNAFTLSQNGCDGKANHFDCLLLDSKSVDVQPTTVCPLYLIAPPRTVPERCGCSRGTGRQNSQEAMQAGKMQCPIMYCWILGSANNLAQPRRQRSPRQTQKLRSPCSY